MVAKCDKIKGNESEVGNTDFELQAKRGYKFLCFTCFFFFFYKLQRLVHISATRCPIELGRGLNQNAAFKIDKWFTKKSKNFDIADMRLIPLIMLEMHFRGAKILDIAENG